MTITQKSTDRLLVVGDIHGCLNELRRLIDNVQPVAGDTLVFLGDYIDRGPDPKGVIEYLIMLRSTSPARVICLRGNHEDMFLDYLGLPSGTGDGEAFLLNGGIETLRSYGLEPLTDGRSLRQSIPSAHLMFLQSLQYVTTWQNFLMVHAGLNPNFPLTEQDVHDVLWIREPFTQHAHPFPYTVVFGHTPVGRVPKVMLPYHIGIDTGCVFGQRLTCIELPSMAVYQVDAEAKKLTMERLVDQIGWEDGPARKETA